MTIEIIIKLILLFGDNFNFHDKNNVRIVFTILEKLVIVEVSEGSPLSSLWLIPSSLWRIVLLFALMDGRMILT